MLTPAEEVGAAAVGDGGCAAAGGTGWATAAAAMSGAASSGESGAACAGLLSGTVVAAADGDGECGDGWLSIGAVEGGWFNLKGA